MSQIIRAWQRYQNRPKYDGPDAAMLDGHKVTLKEESTMPREFKLPSKHMDNVIRLIKTASLDHVKHLRTASFNNLKRLELKRNLKVARTKVPKGSDQFDLGSIITWMNQIPKTDKKAKQQLLVIDATACRRMGG